MIRKRDDDQSDDPILHHGQPTGDEGLAIGDAESIKAISGHITRHLGPIEMVFHEIISTTVHVDIHHVAPIEDRPFHTLVTSGMSDRAMTVPDGVGQEWAYAELLVTLPPDWPMTQADFRNEEYYWPLRMMKVFARFPHLYETWLSWGHSLPLDGIPPNTGFSAAVLLPPLTVPDEFRELRIGRHKLIRFFSIVPLYPEELDLKIEKGVESLFDPFEAAGIADLIDPDRPNVAIGA